MTKDAVSPFGLQLIGGPTALMDYATLRWLTDPTLSPPGEYGGLTKPESTDGLGVRPGLAR